MLAALTTLLLFQLVGEVLTRSLALPVPGPVIGMVLLFVFLVLKEGGKQKSRFSAAFGKFRTHLSDGLDYARLFEPMQHITMRANVQARAPSLAPP